MELLIVLLIPASFVISWGMTLLVKRFAPRFGFVDKPGIRKIHHVPKPLGGGIAILLGMILPMIAGLIFAQFVELPGQLRLYQDGIRHETPAAFAMLGAMVAMHLLGLWDDRKALGPFLKLFIQLAITAGLVIAIPDLRALTVLGEIPSIIISVLWITGIVNAFNFLDNMDGLSAGVAAVSATAFLVTTLTMAQPQWFVAAMLALLIGAAVGFLCFNFNPATIFMGDSGSLLLGLVLGVLTIRTTYLSPGVSSGAVLSPLIVLAVPLYDLIVVSIIRISRGKSPFVGDTNHLSHRLVARGMSRRTAVLCIYLMTAATSVAAILLTHATSTLTALLVFGQTLLVLGLVALLEQHPLPQK